MKQKATPSAAKWIAKGAEGSDGEAPAGKSDAPCLDKLLLLKFLEVTRQEGKDPNEKVVDLGLTDRLPAEGKPRTSGKRERLFSDPVQGSSYDEGGPFARQLSEQMARQLSDQTVQMPNGTHISFAAAMQESHGDGGDAHPAQAAAMMEMHAAMMAWVSGMYGGMAYAAAGAGGQTTVMLRNIPNRYTRDMLTERLDASYKGRYDFVYLPIDFNSKCNMGYAFINFGTAASAASFTQEFHGKRTKNVLPGFSSAKVCEVSYARVQGRDANMENLRDEKFVEKLSEHPEWQPLFYDDDGKEIPFSKTLGTATGKKKSRAPAAPPGQLWPVPMMYPPVVYAPPVEPAVTLSSVLPYATAETMLMLKEVPAALTQEELAGHLDKGHKGTYDFLYLPRDIKAQGNRGFAFINFRSKEKAERFSKDFNGVKAFEGEEKACEVTNARLHSLEGSIARSQSSKTRSAGQKEKWGPVLISEDGKTRPLPLLSPSLGVKGKGPGADAADQGEGKKKGPKTPAYPPWGFPPYMAAMQVASMVAHTRARQAAAKHAGDVLLPPKPALFTPVELAPFPPERKETLFKQIEFYFSTQNLVKDVFLRQQMDNETGYVPLQLIADFPKVRKLGATMDDLLEVVAMSETLELDATKALIRLKDEDARSRWKAPVMSRQVSEEPAP